MRNKLFYVVGYLPFKPSRQHLIDTLSLDDILIPEQKLCADNAMIGLAYEELINAGVSPIKVPFCMPQLGLRFAHS